MRVHVVWRFLRSTAAAVPHRSGQRADQGFTTGRDERATAPMSSGVPISPRMVLVPLGLARFPDQAEARSRTETGVQSGPRSSREPILTTAESSRGTRAE